MKRVWGAAKLFEVFTLKHEEMGSLDGKPASTQIELAVLLKFYEYEGRFPYYPVEIPEMVVQLIADQLGIATSQFAE